MFIENSSEKKYNCKCGKYFSSIEEFEEHFDLIIQYFI